MNKKESDLRHSRVLSKINNIYEALRLIINHYSEINRTNAFSQRMLYGGFDENGLRVLGLCDVEGELRKISIKNNTGNLSDREYTDLMSVDENRLVEMAKEGTRK